MYWGWLSFPIQRNHFCIISVQDAMQIIWCTTTADNPHNVMKCKQDSCDSCGLLVPHWGGLLVCTSSFCPSVIPSIISRLIWSIFFTLIEIEKQNLSSDASWKQKLLHARFCSQWPWLWPLATSWNKMHCRPSLGHFSYVNWDRKAKLGWVMHLGKRKCCIKHCCRYDLDFDLWQPIEKISL